MLYQLPNTTDIVRSSHHNTTSCSWHTTCRTATALSTAIRKKRGAVREPQSLWQLFAVLKPVHHSTETYKTLQGQLDESLGQLLLYNTSEFWHVQRDSNDDVWIKQTNDTMQQDCQQYHVFMTTWKGIESLIGNLWWSYTIRSKQYESPFTNAWTPPEWNITYNNVTSRKRNNRRFLQWKELFVLYKRDVKRQLL